MVFSKLPSSASTTTTTSSFFNKLDLLSIQIRTVQFVYSTSHVRLTRELDNSEITKQRQQQLDIRTRFQPKLKVAPKMIEIKLAECGHKGCKSTCIH